MSHGFSHVGVSTHDMDETIRFYEQVLGCKRLAQERIHVEQGGTLRQVSFDVGGEQYLVFMEARGVPGIAQDYDTGINGALGVPAGMYHFALRIPTLEDLQARQRALLAHGVAASALIDLGIAVSVFFLDPNGLQIELCCPVRPFTAADLQRESAASIALP